MGDEKFAKSNHERLSKSWEVYGGNATTAETIFDHKSMLPDLWKKARADFVSGGYFNIKRVRMDGRTFRDYWIVIESIPRSDHAAALKKCHEEQ